MGTVKFDPTISLITEKYRIFQTLKVSISRIMAEFDILSKSLSSGSLRSKRRILLKAFQGSKDPKFCCYFNCTTDSGNISHRAIRQY